MLVRDKIGEQLEEQFKEYDTSDVEIIRLQTNEELFNAILDKIKNELDLLSLSKSADNLAEIIELVDWLQICLGTTHIANVVEHRKEKMGLYYKKYYVRERGDEDYPVEEEKEDD